MIKWNDVEINKVKQTDVSLGLFKWLSSLVERLHWKKGGEKKEGKKRRKEKQKGDRGDEAREQLSSAAAPNNSPVISLQRADAQVPGGISAENVRREINLPANLCEEGELFTSFQW